jgi:methylglutaconyl-CoA hydratase
VHEVLPDAAALDERVETVVAEILDSGPNAVRRAKRLILKRRSMSDAAFGEHVVGVAARQRVSDEGQEGLTAFLEKRPPSWRS